MTKQNQAKALTKVSEEQVRQVGRQPQQITPELFEMQQRQARMFAVSGAFADIHGKTQEQAIALALVKIQLGYEMGLSAIESMHGISLIQGRPAVGAHIRARKMRQAGYSWRFIEQTDEACEIEIRYLGHVQGTCRYTMEDAKRAGLVKPGGAWTKSPSDMLYARCITRAQRRFAPEVLYGEILDPTEVGMIVDSGAGAASATTEKAAELRERLAEKKQEPEEPTEVKEG